jgi:hypothetical protein
LDAQDREIVAGLEKRDFLFPDVEPGWWAKVEHP